MDKDNLIGLKKMAFLLEVHPSTLRSWAKLQLIPFYRIGKKYYFELEEVKTSTINVDRKKGIEGITTKHKGITISNGFIQIYIGDHPMANKNGYIALHRLIMQAMIGRRIESNEIVHPKNGNALDFKVDNLELRTSLGDHNSSQKSLREDNEM